MLDKCPRGALWTLRKDVLSLLISSIRGYSELCFMPRKQTAKKNNQFSHSISPFRCHNTVFRQIVELLKSFLKFRINELFIRSSQSFFVCFLNHDGKRQRSLTWLYHYEVNYCVLMGVLKMKLTFRWSHSQRDRRHVTWKHEMIWWLSL